VAAREPCQKGTSVLPVVAALKAHPDRQKLVPERLWKYFDDHLLVSGWYPERDYFVLLEALAKTIDPQTSGGDVWRFFAKFSVQRDLAGADFFGVAEKGSAGAIAVANSSANSSKGVYRSFIAGDAADPAQFFRRAVRLWTQYHDTGTMEMRGGRASTNTVVAELVGFHIPIEGFVRLQGYYLEEYGRLIGLEVESKVTRSTARGQRSSYQWEYTLARTPTTEAYVASLLPLP
jgi:hypothetical protein